MTHPSRREALVALSAAALGGCASPCGLRTGAQTEGPYYPGEPEVRSTITEDRGGVPLSLTLTITAFGECTPIAGAEVDLWCADADGAYSGYDDFNTAGESWLRGQQTTDAAGQVTFESIVPGSYPGRAVHLHVKVRVDGEERLTTQVYLPDAFATDALAADAYLGSAAQTLNAEDDFYDDDTLLSATGDAATGVTATGTLVV